MLKRPSMSPDDGYAVTPVDHAGVGHALARLASTIRPVSFCASMGTASRTIRRVTYSVCASKSNLYILN